MSGEDVAVGGFAESALRDELGDGAGEGRAGDAEDEGGLLQVGYRAVVLNVAYDARGEGLEGELHEAVAQEHTVVGDDSEVVLHDGLVGFQDTQHGFPADEPDAAVGGGDDGYGKDAVCTEDK